MTHRTALAALIGGALSLAAMAQTKNEWTLKPSGKPGFVQLAIERTSDGDRNHWQRGITEKQLEAGNGGAVRFQIVRDAGTLQCDGVAHNGRALGSFTFQANANYAAQLASAGFRMTPKHSAIDYFLMDVSLDFARAVRQYDVSATDADLFALRIHGVDMAYLQKLQSHGLRNLDSKKIVQMKVHGID
ncbi:MAG: hypothetical protein JST65_03800 [Acidobacteria bacterium]|nr:hypothetical protein [Acidobacteriota bacterium]